MAKLSYETTSCSRCGGSGNYSYCTMHGTTCFKCSGRRVMLSKAGAKARAKVEALKSSLAETVLAVEAKPGMVVRDHNGRYATLLAVNAESESRYSKAGEEPSRYVELTFKSGSWHVCRETKLSLALSPEAVAKVVALAKTLKGATVTEG